ncbi:MAG: hypothetical protein QM610_15075 [Chitinophagaceae bacterium]
MNNINTGLDSGGSPSDSGSEAGGAVFSAEQLESYNSFNSQQETFPQPSPNGSAHS